MGNKPIEAQMRDLEGLLVVTLEHAVAAPYASGRLADAGARVIKVERSEGDFARQYDRHVKGGSAYFVWLNRGKESICLDLKAQDDKEILAAMLAEADVFIQNLAPGAMDRLGFSMSIARLLKQADRGLGVPGGGRKLPFAHLGPVVVVRPGELKSRCLIGARGRDQSRGGVDVIKRLHDRTGIPVQADPV